MKQAVVAICMRGRGCGELLFLKSALCGPVVNYDASPSCAIPVAITPGSINSGRRLVHRNAGTGEQTWPDRLFATVGSGLWGRTVVVLRRLHAYLPAAKLSVADFHPVSK